MQSEDIEYISDHVSQRVAAMEAGQITDCQGLFEPELWNAVPAFDRRYIFGRPVAMLVAQGRLPLEFAGFNNKRHNLYRKKKS